MSKAAKAPVSVCLGGRAVCLSVGRRRRWLESLSTEWEANILSTQPTARARSFASLPWLPCLLALLTGLEKEVTMTSSSSALPECVMSVDDFRVDYGNGTSRVCVVATDVSQQFWKHSNPWFCPITQPHDLDEQQDEHDHLVDCHSYPADFRLLLPSSSSSPSAPFKPFKPIHYHHPRPSSTQHEAYDADEEFESDDDQRGILSTTTMSTSGHADPLGKQSTLRTRWLTKVTSVPTLRRRRSSLSSNVHSFLHPPSIDDHSSPEGTLSHLPIPSPYTTASSTEDGYTTGSEDFFATPPQVIRLDEHDSFLLDDDPDPFANYLSRARSSLSINSSPPDHIHTHSHSHAHAQRRGHPLSATPTAVPTQTQPKPYLALFTPYAQNRFSSAGPPTLNGGVPRHRLLNRPSLPSLGGLAQRFSTSTSTKLPTTDEYANLDSPILLPPSSSTPFIGRFPVDPWKHPDRSAPPTSYRTSVPSVFGGRQGEALRRDSNAGYLPVWSANKADASLNACPRLPYSNDTNTNITRHPGAASSDRGTSSFVGGSGSGSSRQYQQNYTAHSNQHSYSQYSGGGMGGGGGTGGGRGGGGGGGGGGGDRSDGDRDRKPRGYKGVKSDHSTDAYTTTTTEDEQQGNHRGNSSNRSGNATTDSDDTPLARRLPGALTAQKSLRRQVRDDQDVQRQVRARVRAKSAPRQPAPPSRGAEGSGGGSVSADELTRKLLKVQVQSPSSQLPPFNYGHTPLTESPSHIEQHASTSTSTYNKYTFAASPPRPHRPDAYPLNKTGGDSSDWHYPHTSPVARPNTATHPSTSGNMAPFLQFPHNPHPPQQQQQQQPQVPHSLQRAMTSATAQLRSRSRRPSHEMPEPRQRTETLLTKPARQRANTLSSPAAPRPTTSSMSPSTPAVPAVPPLPTTTPTSSQVPVPTLPGRGFAHAGDAGPTMQQRVFVGDLQRFSIVEIGQSTKARDVIAMVDEKGELPHDAKAGGWMLFELSNDFGMGESLESKKIFWSFLSLSCY